MTFPTNLPSHSSSKITSTLPSLPPTPPMKKATAHEFKREAVPQPCQGCNRNAPSTSKRGGMQKTKGLVSGKAERQREEMGGQGSTGEIRMPEKANCLLLFLLFFRFPRLHELSSGYLLLQRLLCMRLVVFRFISKNMKFNKETAQLNTTHFDLV